MIAKCLLHPYLVDDASAGTGFIAGGWSLVISPDPPTPPDAGSTGGQPGSAPAVPRKKCKKKHLHQAAASKKGCKKKK